MSKQAEEATRPITDPWDRAQALAAVAVTLAVNGDRKGAAAAAAHAEEAAGLPPAQQRLEYEFECDYGREDDEDEDSYTDPAAELARQLDKTTAKVAVALAASGHLGRAADIARSVEDPDERSEALMHVAVELAAIGQRAEAEGIARLIGSGEQRAVALAAAGLDDEAEAAARKVRDAGALARISAALAKTGHVRTASRLAVAACAAGDWTIAAKPALLLNPSAITTVMAMLASDNSTPAGQYRMEFASAFGLLPASPTSTSTSTASTEPRRFLK